MWPRVIKAQVPFWFFLLTSIYTLLRIINVEKRRDSARGNRYLVELELMERGRSVVRLSEYIYLLLHRSRQGEESLENTDSPPASAPSAATSSLATPPLTPSNKSPSRPGVTPGSTAYAKPLLCQPVMLQWRKDVMVHFVVPGQSEITLFFLVSLIYYYYRRELSHERKKNPSLTCAGISAYSFTVLAELYAKHSLFKKPFLANRY